MKVFITAVLLSSSAHAFNFMDLLEAGEAMTAPLSKQIHIGGSGWWDKKKFKGGDPNYIVVTNIRTICPDPDNDVPCYTIVTKSETLIREEKF